MHIYFYSGYYSSTKSAHAIALDGIYSADKPIISASTYTLLKNILEEKYGAIPEQLYLTTFVKLDEDINETDLLKQELKLRKEQEKLFEAQFKRDLANKELNPEIANTVKKTRTTKK